MPWYVLFSAALLWPERYTPENVLVQGLYVSIRHVTSGALDTRHTLPGVGTRFISYLPNPCDEFIFGVFPVDVENLQAIHRSRCRGTVVR